MPLPLFLLKALYFLNRDSSRIHFCHYLDNWKYLAFLYSFWFPLVHQGLIECLQNENHSNADCIKTHKHVKHQCAKCDRILPNSELEWVLMVYLMERSFDLALFRWLASIDVAQIFELQTTLSFGGQGNSSAVWLMKMRRWWNKNKFEEMLPKNFCSREWVLCTSATRGMELFIYLYLSITLQTFANSFWDSLWSGPLALPASFSSTPFFMSTFHRIKCWKEIPFILLCMS